MMTWEFRGYHAASGCVDNLSSRVALEVDDWLGAFSFCNARHRRELHDELWLRVDWLCVPCLSIHRCTVQLIFD